MFTINQSISFVEVIFHWKETLYFLAILIALTLMTRLILKIYLRIIFTKIDEAIKDGNWVYVTKKEKIIRSIKKGKNYQDYLVFLCEGFFELGQDEKFKHYLNKIDKSNLCCYIAKNLMLFYWYLINKDIGTATVYLIELLHITDDDRIERNAVRAAELLMKIAKDNYICTEEERQFLNKHIICNKAKKHFNIA